MLFEFAFVLAQMLRLDCVKRKIEKVLRHPFDAIKRTIYLGVCLEENRTPSVAQLFHVLTKWKDSWMTRCVWSIIVTNTNRSLDRFL